MNPIPMLTRYLFFVASGLAALPLISQLTDLEGTWRATELSVPATLPTLDQGVQQPKREPLSAEAIRVLRDELQDRLICGELTPRPVPLSLALSFHRVGLDLQELGDAELRTLYGQVCQADERFQADLTSLQKTAGLDGSVEAFLGDPEFFRATEQRWSNLVLEMDDITSSFLR
jgi:hypothetical protein